MTEQVVKATEALEFTFTKLEQYFAAAEKAIQQYGGDVVDLGMNVLRIEAASEIAAPFLWFFFLIIIFILSVITLRRNREYWFTEEIQFFIPAFCFGLSSIGLLTSASHLVNIWAWVGIFYPELYAVHKFVLT